jgi:adenylate kinase family enzyme
MRRVNVIGTSGSGKTTTGAELARRLGVPHIEVDALSWEPNWVMAPTEVLRERVAAAIAADAWVVDGNYTASRDLVWARADTIVWLDLPLPIIMWRVTTRTIRRLATGEVLWNGNRESLRTALSRDSIILWALQTYGRRRHDYPSQLAAQKNAQVVRLRSPGEVRRFLEAIPPPAPAPTPTAPRTEPALRPEHSSAEAGTTRGRPGQR